MTCFTYGMLCSCLHRYVLSLRTAEQKVAEVKIRGVEGLTVDQLGFEVDRGAAFIMYRYCWSAIVVTFKEASDIHFIGAGENRVVRGLPYILLTLLLGWWGFPWGPIYSIQSLLTDFQGGEDVTDVVLLQLRSATAGTVTS